jgi:hypothetical protein
MFCCRSKNCIRFIEGLLCGTCGTGSLVVQARTRSFASSVSVLCTNPSCEVWGDSKASRSKVFDRDAHRSSWKSRPAEYKNNHDVLDQFDAYELNLKMVLTMQQMGKAEASFESIRSSIGIESTAVKGYSTYEQKISLTHIRLAERILQENLEQEIESTQMLTGYEGDENG